MGRLRSATRTSIAVATHQLRKYLCHLQENMLFLAKSNPKFSS